MRETCLGRRILVGITVSDSPAAREAMTEGFIRIVRIGVDLPLISRAVTSLVREISG